MLELPDLVQDLDEASLDNFLEDAVQDALGKQALGRNIASTWLRKFANKSKTETEAATLIPIVAAVRERIRASDYMSAELVSVHPELENQFDSISACERRRPAVGQNVVGILATRTLIVHVDGRPCSSGGRRIEWKRSHWRGQSFVVSMRNRQGIASQVLSVISGRAVDIIEIAAARLGPGWAVMRVHTQSVPKNTVAKIDQELRAIHGIERVVLPDAPVVPVLEGPLPPRNESRNVLRGDASPFVCGPPVVDDAQFYGRRGELEKLRTIFQALALPEARSGGSAFVTGPFKVGKTSLLSISFANSSARSISVYPQA